MPSSGILPREKSRESEKTYAQKGTPPCHSISRVQFRSISAPSSRRSNMERRCLMSDPTDSEFDLIVAGGGLAGVCAAIAASRHGLRTALIERAAFLGDDSGGPIRRPIVGADVWG